MQINTVCSGLLNKDVRKCCFESHSCLLKVLLTVSDSGCQVQACSAACFTSSHETRFQELIADLVSVSSFGLKLLVDAFLPKFPTILPSV